MHLKLMRYCEQAFDQAKHFQLVSRMARPPAISQFLANAKPRSASTNETDGVSIKPKFLSKAEREQLLIQQQKSTVVTNQRSPDCKRKELEEETQEGEVDQLLAKENYRDVKKSRFQFEWNENEDTLAEYKPIVSLKVADLLPRPQSTVEELYMGKHWAEKTQAEMTDRDWRIFKEDYGLSTKGAHIEPPLRSWEDLRTKGGDIVDTIVKRLKYKDPTPIQRAAIPNVCTKKYRDLLGVASTGSGKTLAFLVPILIKFNQMPIRPPVVKRMEGSLALILVPTRELAQQIEREAQKFINLWGNSYQVVSIVGGHSIEEISFQLSHGTDILVATPGRLIDCLENHVLSIDSVETLVLDEADRMIDLGFEEQVTTILSKLDNKRKGQTMMFTATMTPGIEKIANGYLKGPAYVTVGGADGSVPMIQQIVEHGPSEEHRFKRIVELLPHFKPPVIIFISYKRTADWLAQKFFKETSWKVAVLHGSKSQEQREHSLQLLRKGKVQIMIASNVAARGLDVPNVSLVINFQVSKTFEDYVHRIGRTGRAGHKGTAITFLDDEEPEFVGTLYNYLQRHNPTNKNSFATSLREKYNLGKTNKDEVLY